MNINRTRLTMSENRESAGPENKSAFSNGLSESLEICAVHRSLCFAQSVFAMLALSSPVSPYLNKFVALILYLIHHRRADIIDNQLTLYHSRCSHYRVNLKYLYFNRNERKAKKFSSNVLGPLRTSPM